jgi:uncharacterized membrane protein YbhN (UPF0104 family)
VAWFAALRSSAGCCWPRREAWSGRVRRWLAQTRDHLLKQLADRRRFGRIVGWTAVSTGAYAASFCLALRAVGSTTAASALVAAFLVGTAVANAIPAPGGVGPDELAVVGALSAQGTPAATAIGGVLLLSTHEFLAAERHRRGGLAERAAGRRDIPAGPRRLSP